MPWFPRWEMKTVAAASEHSRQTGKENVVLVFVSGPRTFLSSQHEWAHRFELRRLIAHEGRGCVNLVDFAVIDEAEFKANLGYE